MTFYSSSMEDRSSPPDGSSVVVEGLEKPAIVHSGGMTLVGSDGKMVWMQLNILCTIPGVFSDIF